MANGDTKNKILETSIDLFCEHGFTKASMREISRSGNITLSVIYNHFKDKYDILYTILMEIASALEEAIGQTLEKSTPGVDALSNIIITQMCLIKERPKEIKIYLEDQHLLPEPLRSTVLARHRLVYDIYFKQVEIIEQEGSLRQLDKSVVTFSILAAVNWAYRWYKIDGKLSMEEVAKDTVKMCLGGILKEPREKNSTGLRMS